MKSLSVIVCLIFLFSAVSAMAETLELRLSWNRDHKVDLQVMNGMPQPQRVNVISERGAIVSSHLFTEYAEGQVNFSELSAGSYQVVLISENGDQIRAERFEFDPESRKEVTFLTLRLLATGTFGDRTANPANTTGNVISPFNPEQ